MAHTTGGFAAPCSPRGRRQRQSAIGAVRSVLPPVEVAQLQLRTLWELATPERRSDGATWYDRAHACARELATSAGAPTSAGAGVIAALSPQCSWSENVRLATETLTTGVAPLGPSGEDGQRKAQRIADGAPPEHVLGGRKVRSFYANVLRPERPGPVTVDRHAVSALYGAPITEHQAKVLERIGAYSYCAAQYRSAARSAGVSPHVLQATVWLVWRDTHAPGWAQRDELLDELASADTGTSWHGTYTTSAGF